jgi:hypothetical protein
VQNNGNYLRHRHLASRVITDILALDFGPAASELAPTLALALRIAGANILQLDIRELGHTISTCPNGGHLVPVVYDDVPGGAGHVGQLLTNWEEWRMETIQVLFVDENHHKTCSTACLDCLLTGGVYNEMEVAALQRSETHDFLSHWIEKGDVPILVKINESTEAKKFLSRLSREERIARHKS